MSARSAAAAAAGVSRSVVRRHVLRVHVPQAVVMGQSGMGAASLEAAAAASSSSSPGSASSLTRGAGAVVVLDALRVFQVPSTSPSPASPVDGDSAPAGSEAKPPMHLASLMWVASPTVGANKGGQSMQEPLARSGYFASLFKKHLVPAVPGLEVLLLGTQRMRVYGADGRQLPRERFSFAVDYALAAVARQEMRRPRKVLRTNTKVTGADMAGREAFFQKFENARAAREAAAAGNSDAAAAADVPPSLAARPLDAPMLRPVVVGGYGYLGAQQAARVMLSTPDRLAGCAVASGFVSQDIIDRVRDDVIYRVGDTDTATELVEGNLNTPFLVCLGENDPRISQRAARVAFDKGIARWNPNAHFRLTRGKGEFAQEETSILLSWLGQVLGTESPTLDPVRPQLTMHQHLQVAGTRAYERTPSQTMREEARAMGEHFGFYQKADGKFITRETRDALRANTGFNSRFIERAISAGHVGQ